MNHPIKTNGNAQGFKRAVQSKDSLLGFLLKYLHGLNKKEIKTLVKNQMVLVDRKPCSDLNTILNIGSVVETTGTVKHQEPKPSPSLKGLEILFEDKDLLIIEKPEGMLSMATEKEKRETAYSILSQYLKNQNPTNRIFIVHRLDRETSGLMVFAKNEPAKLTLQKSWNENVLSREYVAVLEGCLEQDQGTVTSYLHETSSMLVISSQNPNHGLFSSTHFKVIQKNKLFSLVSLDLETGRKNQIRVHMNDIGHPVTGDKKYGARINPIKRLALHAKSLCFIHPSSGKKMEFESTIPKSFLSLFKHQT